MKYLIILLALLVSCSTTTQPKKSKKSSKTTKPKEIRSCVCMEIYQPVCASDGMTYANACEASCQGLKFQNGACI
jgi:hypothetical protein